ncbi:MAG: DUF2066 domain-containing protein [Alphaproteobacteria bacterium]|nr:DUF2066 domain-containing protein [Alphaproteobacteria bacterium]
MSGIKVDASAENAAKARDKALQDGQKQALISVMERITPEYVSEQLGDLVPEDTNFLVQDMSLSNEKTSSVRYIANMEVRFSPDGVRNLLKQNDLPFVRIASKPLLVLPVYKKNSSANPLLWDNENPWLRAWNNNTTKSYMVPLVVPMGDFDDFRDLSIEQVVSGDVVSAKTFAKKNMAEGVLVVQAVRRGQDFEISIKGMDETTSLEIPEYKFKMPLQGNTNETLKRAIRKIIAKLEQDWKVSHIVQMGNLTPFVIMAPVKSVEQWIALKNRLAVIPSISDIKLQACTSEVLQIIVQSASNFDVLKREMEKRNLIIESLPSGVYRLQVKGMDEDYVSFNAR